MAAGLMEWLILFYKNMENMTLEESLQKLDELMSKERELLKDIQKNHIHSENDKLVFYRYKNANNERMFYMYSKYRTWNNGTGRLH